MGVSSLFRTLAVLSFATAASGATLVAAAHAEPASSDCETVAPINAEFKAATKDLFTPEEVKQLKAAKNAKDADKDELIGKIVGRMLENDPTTGERRLESFLGHLRRVAELARGASGQLQDTQAVDAVDKLGDGLDGYLGLYDRLVGKADETTDPTGAEDSADADGESAEKSAESTGESDESAELDQMGPALQGFIDGIQAYGDYAKQSCGDSEDATLLFGGAK